ncbi:MAG: hypothetical protein HYT87_02110 [Nitrospirae bacterium]|nr:hypothetical protein [Nitrospirota bacterium]
MRLLTENAGKQRILDTERLSLSVIQKKIEKFERKHGDKLSTFSKRLTCDSSDFSTLADLMEWEMLEKELRLRKVTGRKRQVAR